MVTRYVWNMIAFLRCHYAYLSIILTRLKSQFCARLLSKKNQHQLKIKILSDLVDCLLRYQCSIAIKYCISVIATHRSPAAFTRSLVFVSCKNGCVTINKAATCDTSLQVLCDAAYVTPRLKISTY